MNIGLNLWQQLVNYCATSYVIMRGQEYPIFMSMIEMLPFLQQLSFLIWY